MKFIENETWNFHILNHAMDNKILINKTFQRLKTCLTQDEMIMDRPSYIFIDNEI